MLDNYLNIIFGITTLLGFGATIYYGRKAIKLENKRKKIEWTDLQSSSNDLGNKLKKDKFSPDLIFTPGLKGATFVNLLQNELKTNTPVYVGVSYWKQENNGVLKEDNFEYIETNKWYVAIPKNLLDQSEKKILIVDDFVMSGDFLDRLKKLLLNAGFKANNIKSMSVVTTSIAVGNLKAPDYYWFETPDLNFYFPWGKAI